MKKTLMPAALNSLPVSSLVSRRRLLRRSLDALVVGGSGLIAALPPVWAAPPSPVNLLGISHWKPGLTRMVPQSDGGCRVIQNYPKDRFSWAERRVVLDLDTYPEMLVEVANADAKNRWCIKIQPFGEKEVWLLPETGAVGEFVFPVGEYLNRYGKVDCLLRFFVVGDYGASVTLKRLELRGGGAQGVTEQVEIVPNAPLQKVEGAGGQADYPLWTVGKDVDGVTAPEIGTLLDRLKAGGVSVVRVGAYGEVMSAAAATEKKEDAALLGLVRHFQALKRRNFQTVFVAWTPPPHTRSQKAFSDAWLASFVSHCADFAVYCKTQGVPIAYFQPQNEPHADGNRAWWNPEFLGRCGAALSQEFVKRELNTLVIGPDGLGEEWAVAWVQAMGTRSPVIALKAGAGERGGVQETARTVARIMARCREVGGGAELRFWLTEYGSWAWGNADKDRRAGKWPRRRLPLRACDG